MTYPFTPIKRWSHHETHLRNIEISLYVAQGNTFQNTGEKFNFSRHRVNQIYRILMALLAERYFPWVNSIEAFYSKTYYNHPARLKMINDYKMEYINFMLDKFKTIRDM
jgi:hypothetical protein